MRKISPPPGLFFYLNAPRAIFSVPFFFLWSIFVLLNPSLLLHVTLCSILLSLYNKHNTNIHALGGIRTHNSSKRAAVDPRLRPRGHWDRQIRSPDPPARSDSLYRLRYPGPFPRYVCNIMYSVCRTKCALLVQLGIRLCGLNGRRRWKMSFGKNFLWIQWMIKKFKTYFSARFTNRLTDFRTALYEYMASNDRPDEWWTGNDVGEKRLWPNSSTIPAHAWRDGGKPRQT